MLEKVDGERSHRQFLEKDCGNRRIVLIDVP